VISEVDNLYPWTLRVVVVEESRRRRLLVFNDTIEGPRAPAVKPGRVTQAPRE
jgi:hypothetical protein